MMRNPIPQATANAGFWSAVVCTVFSVTYVLAQLAEWQGWLGSEGGPESSSTAFGLFILLTPSLFLAPVFLALIASVHQLAAPEHKVWSQIALGFAGIYATMICIVYYVQLTLVAPRLLQQRIEGIEPFLFVPFDSFLYAVDILGYSFMCAALLFAALVLDGEHKERLARRWMLENGLLIPFLLLQMYVHSLVWIASLWAIVFPAATWALARQFHCARHQPSH